MIDILNIRKRIILKSFISNPLITKLIYIEDNLLNSKYLDKRFVLNNKESTILGHLVNFLYESGHNYKFISFHLIETINDVIKKDSELLFDNIKFLNEDKSEPIFIPLLAIRYSFYRDLKFNKETIKRNSEDRPVDSSLFHKKLAETFSIVNTALNEFKKKEEFGYYSTDYWNEILNRYKNKNESLYFYIIFLKFLNKEHCQSSKDLVLNVISIYKDMIDKEQDNNLFYNHFPMLDNMNDLESLHMSFFIRKVVSVKDNFIHKELSQALCFHFFKLWDSIDNRAVNKGKQGGFFYSNGKFVDGYYDDKRGHLYQVQFIFSVINLLSVNNCCIKESFTREQLEHFHQLYIDFKMEESAKRMNDFKIVGGKNVLIQDTFKKMNQIKQNYNNANKIIEKILLESTKVKEKKPCKIL